MTFKMFIIYFFDIFTSKILRITYFFSILIFRLPFKFYKRATFGTRAVGLHHYNLK